MPKVFFNYQVFESNSKQDAYNLTDEGEIGIEDIEEARAETETKLPDRIYARNWISGENGSHYIIQTDSIAQAIVILSPANVEEIPIINWINTDYLRKAVNDKTTQPELAEALGVNQQQISRWLIQGKRIKTETLMKLCDAINLDIRLLFNRDAPFL